MIQKLPYLQIALGTACLAALLLQGCTLRASADSQLVLPVLREMNSARTDPKAFVSHLQRHRGLFEGKRYRTPDSTHFVITREGMTAVDEAIAFLQGQAPLPPLAWAQGLSRSAEELVRSQAQSGTTGHGRGKLAMAERISRHVEWRGSIGENISYGPDDGLDVVLQLIIDDGVPGRGHRANIFSPDFRLAGVACGPHPTFGKSCVIDYAGGIKP